MNSPAPVQVQNLTGVADIGVGAYHSLAVQADGIGRAWGYNTYGQLGNGGTANSNVPVVVKDLKGVSQLSGGFYHSLALQGTGADLLPPTITIDHVTLKGKVTGDGAVTLKVDNRDVTVGADGTWTAGVPVSASPRDVPVVATDPSGNVTTKTVRVAK